MSDQIQKSPDRLKVLERIRQNELDGNFNVDVEADPPTRPLKKGECDFANRKLSSKIASFFANIAARSYYEKLIKKGDFIIENVVGLENFPEKGGAFITCNHFSVLDNYAVYRVIRKKLGGNLYKVIREGNYTSFPGLYGYFFRHCNTLPLSDNYETLKEFMSGVEYLIKKGKKILIYPEQCMWWNYRKPRPLKDGAFNLAVRNGAPIIPFFITMRDDRKIGADGFPVQRFTVHISKPIYPDPALDRKQNVKRMKDYNFECWKNIYQSVYGVELAYDTKEQI